MEGKRASKQAKKSKKKMKTKTVWLIFCSIEQNRHPNGIGNTTKKQRNEIENNNTVYQDIYRYYGCSGTPNQIHTPHGALRIKCATRDKMGYKKNAAAARIGRVSRMNGQRREHGHSPMAWIRHDTVRDSSISLTVATCFFLSRFLHGFLRLIFFHKITGTVTCVYT